MSMVRSEELTIFHAKTEILEFRERFPWFRHSFPSFFSKPLPLGACPLSLCLGGVSFYLFISFGTRNSHLPSLLQI